MDSGRDRRDRGRHDPRAVGLSTTIGTGATGLGIPAILALNSFSKLLLKHFPKISLRTGWANKPPIYAGDYYVGTPLRLVLC